jgi:transposase, IS6 family
MMQRTTVAGRASPKVSVPFLFFGAPAGQSWRVDETCVKIEASGAICTGPSTGPERLSISGSVRGKTAAKAFFKKAIKSQGSVPRTITLDGYAASHRAVREMKRDSRLPGGTMLRSWKYLDNLIKQDHRHIRSRVNVMLGFKWFSNAAIVIAGIELMHRIRKEQFDLRINIKDTSAPAVWNAVLSA